MMCIASGQNSAQTTTMTILVSLFALLQAVISIEQVPRNPLNNPRPTAAFRLGLVRMSTDISCQDRVKNVAWLNSWREQYCNLPAAAFLDRPMEEVAVSYDAAEVPAWRYEEFPIMHKCRVLSDYGRCPRALLDSLMFGFFKMSCPENFQPEFDEPENPNLRKITCVPKPQPEGEEDKRMKSKVMDAEGSMEKKPKEAGLMKGLLRAFGGMMICTDISCRDVGESSGCKEL